MIKKRAELHLHTKLSNDISVIDVKEILDKAEEYGLSAIAFTNLNNVQDFPEIARYAQDTNVKIIYGAEVICQDSKEGHIYKLTLLVRNQEGIKELYKVISSIDRKGDCGVIDISVLMRNRDNLLIGSNGFEDVLFCDYFEIYPARNKQEEEINKKIYLLGKGRGIPVVAVSNAHYLTKDDAICCDIVRFSKGTKERENKNLYLRTTKELLDEFAYLGEFEAEEVVINNTQILSDMLERVEPLKKGFYGYRFGNDYEKVEKISVDKAKEIYGDPLPEMVVQRLQTELDLIKRNDYAPHYLITHKIAKYITDSGHGIGSRGTSGSVFVAFLLGITDINPLPPHYYCPKCHRFEKSNLVKDGFDLPYKECPICNNKLQTDGHDIPFESFMGLDGSKRPDFNINIAEEIKTSVIEYIRTLCGATKIAIGGTVGTFLRKGAQDAVEYYDTEMSISFSEEEKEKLIQKIVGVKRYEGYHPGGVMVIPADMEFEDFTPLKRNAEGMVTTHFNFLDVHNTLFKMNILCFTGISFLEILQRKTGVELNEINLMDPAVQELFKDFDTTGLLGYDQEFMWDLLARTMPETFADFLKFRGFASGTDVWSENGEYIIEEGVPLSDMPTLREDIMNDLISVGVSRTKAYQFSEAVWKGRMVSGRVRAEDMLPDTENLKSLGDWYLDYCSKIRYMFPKAHAVAYVCNDLCCLWFKKYYPKEFYETYLELYFGDKEYLDEIKRAEYNFILQECAARGIVLK